MDTVMETMPDAGQYGEGKGSGAASAAGGKELRIVVRLEEETLQRLAALLASALRGRADQHADSALAQGEGGVVSAEAKDKARVAVPPGVSPLPIPAERPPAVDPKASVLPDALICLEDGRRMTMLKRYLRTRYGLTPEQYRARWGLPADYPMVAPQYAIRRSDIARQSGLGRKRKDEGAAAEVPEEAA